MKHTNYFELNEQTLAVIEELGGHMPGGFFIYRAAPPEELIYANQPVFAIYGCETLEEFKSLTGYTFRGMVHPDDYARISSSIEEQIQSNNDNMDYGEYRIVRRDGAVRWLNDYGHYVETDTYGGVYTVFISDITEKHDRIASDLADHKAEISALHESVEKIHAERLTFSRVAQALAGDYISIYVIEPDTGQYVEYSSTEEFKRFGIEKEGDDFFRLARNDISALIYPEDRERFLAVFSRERVLSILEKDGIFTTKYRLMVDGVPTYVSMKGTLMDDEQGRHLIMGVNKIDAQMKREEEFRARMSEARNKARNDFLANMSHDIRTPMNAIVGYTNIANSHLHDPGIVRDSLEKIGSSSHFLLSLINDVLDMSKIESGKMQLSVGDCDLGAVFRRIEDITSLQARKKSLHIVYNHENVRHLHVRGDELRIEQVLINIVSNAIKYTPEGKSVYLLAEERGQPENGKSRYRFVIRDTGIGIGEDYLPHIFDSFTREQNTRINKIQGTGLGLAITAKVVELMNGTISVKSRPGEGSEFTVELDLELAESPEKRESVSRGQGDQNLAGRRILLVEDNDINAEIAQMTLVQYGMEVERADNGQIGLEKTQQMGLGYYDAVLMDIQMPVMDGYEATRAIRALEGDYFRELPIIAMSANAYDEDVKSCLEAGMNAHIAKPFQPQALLSCLQEYIR